MKHCVLATAQQKCAGLQDMSWRHLQNVFSVTIFRLYDALVDKKLLRWRYLQNMSWTHVLKMSWSQKKKKTCLLGISVSNNAKSVSNKSISDESKVNPKCIN